MLLILLILLFMIWKYYVRSNKKIEETFGWNCVWTPNVDYYKEDWILGNNPGALALARDNIKY